jgi:peptidyl-prolyl cis-trans isomerase A (cyclophilin A)
MTDFQHITNGSSKANATQASPSRPKRRAVVNAALGLSATLAGLAPQFATAQASNTSVLVKTSMGEIVIELYPERAPKTVANFLSYVNSGHYNNTIFHRVIRNFMIQGGGFTRELYKSELRPKPTKKPIELESQNGLRNDAGWVAMARTSDPNSATAQFFINTVDNPSLNYPAPDGFGYAVFGKVTKGMDVVNQIRETATIGIGNMRDVPVQPIMIDSITAIK